MLSNRFSIESVIRLPCSAAASRATTNQRSAIACEQGDCLSREQAVVLQNQVSAHLRPEGCHLGAAVHFVRLGGALGILPPSAATLISLDVEEHLAHKLPQSRHAE